MNEQLIDRGAAPIAVAEGSVSDRDTAAVGAGRPGWSPKLLDVLAVEDDPDDQYLLELQLGPYVNLAFASDLADGVAKAEAGAFDVVLLDLCLPDVDGIETVSEFRRNHPDVAVLVLTGLEDHEVGLAALRAGAEDYLPKSGYHEDALYRAIRFTVERRQIRRDLRELAIEDAETRLPNRRCFAIEANAVLRVARRRDLPYSLVLLSLEGENAAASMPGLAQIVRQTLAESDLVARISERELAVLVAGDEAQVQVAVGCLGVLIDLANVDRPEEGAFRVEIGLTRVDPGEHVTVNTLISRAEAVLRRARAGGHD